MCEIMEKLIIEAKAEGKVEILAALVKDGVITIAEAAERADMIESIFEEYIGLIK